MTSHKTLSGILVFIASFCGVLGLLAVAKALQPPTVDSAKHDLQALYHKMDDGLESKDAALAVDNNASDYVTISKVGERLTAADLRTGLGGLFSHGDHIKSHTHIVKLQLKNRQAIVTTQLHTEYTLTNTTKNPVAGKPAHFRDDSVFIDTWTKDYGRWRIHKSKELKSSETMSQ